MNFDPKFLSRVKCVIYWPTFPPCGMLTSELLAQHDDILLVITKPEFDHDPFYDDLQGNLIIVENSNELFQLKSFLINVSYFIHTGWNDKTILRFGTYLKSTYGTRIGVVSDNSQKHNVRQLIGRLYFRLFLKHKFDFAITPGKSGRRLLTYLGMRPSQIFEGNYGAYSKFFFRDEAIPKENHFLYAGQLIHRKGILDLIAAFEIYRRSGGTWRLKIIGSGELRDQVRSNLPSEAILVDFVQPKTMNIEMNKASTFILPSFEEHWGTVVCEAAAGGCNFILSDKVGALDDLLISGLNGFSFSAGNVSELAILMHRVERLGDGWREKSEELSKHLASIYREKSYSRTILGIMKGE